MRTTVALLAVLLAAGCSATPPVGTDGDLADDWAVPGTPAPFRPQAGQCHEALTTNGALDDYRPVDCGELHVSETIRVGTPADAEVAPAPGTAGAKAAYRECSDAATDFLGGPLRGARIAVQVVWPTRAGWAGGARWFRCDVTTADLDGRSRVSRTGSLAGELAHASPLRLACFDPTVEGGTVTAMTAAPCNGAHRAEFAGLWTAPDISYSKLESDTELSAAGCRGVIARFAALPDDSDLQFRSGWISYNPTRPEWLSGERLVRCFIYFAERTFSRSLKGAGPGVLPVR
nr:hypothetical protein GCM10020092_029810 [Actinoplanes digitatis]